jgi:hypothetical protein
MVKHTGSAALTLVIAVLLFALAPSLTYLGHWPEPSGPPMHAHASSDHESHCHGDVSGCSDGPASVGVPGLAGNDLVVFEPEGPLHAAGLEQAASKVAAFTAAATPPPRHAPLQA